MTDKYIKKGDTYGGELSEYDFDTTYPPCFSSPTNGSNIAKRIEAGWRFDNNCHKEAENRNKRTMDKIKR